MEPPIPPLLASILFFVGMLISLEVGRQFGVSRRPKESEGERNGLGIIEGALFAMFGLVLAFSFSGAASRFNEKRMLIAEEVNTIETAYLRVQLLSPVAQPEVRELFREYVDSRVATYRKLPDMAAAEKEMSRYKELQHEIWTKSVAASLLHDSHPDAGKLLLPALNNMIDITTTRSMALQTHPPRIIYALLFGLGLICSLLAGYRMSSDKHRSWLHILGFTVITVIIVYVMLDAEYPRAGLIRLENADQLLVDLRDGMK
jgi:multidrug transporter EmrE-like cation transporter